jgi:hypothetical protein
VITIWDGTYVYIQKSANYSFQKATYSMHKGRNLVKMMMVFSTTGYIIEVFGRYLADGKNNDAKITKHIAEDGNKLKSYFKNDDLFIVDRGFRDILDYLDSIGIEAKMTAYLEKNKKQHDVLEANESRLVTKIIWVVEAANGVIKTWKYFDNVVLNTNIPHIKRDFRIVCALINKYRKPRVNSKQDNEFIAQKMPGLLDTSNKLKDLVENNKRTKKKNTSIDVFQLKFPVLSEKYIEELTIGI